MTLIFIFLHAPHLSELRTGPSDRKRGWPSHRYLTRGSDAELLTVGLVRGRILALAKILSRLRKAETQAIIPQGTSTYLRDTSPSTAFDLGGSVNLC